MLIAVTAGLCLFSSPTVRGQGVNACDLNRDGVVNSADLQSALQMAFGAVPCSATVVGVGVCTPTLVQRISAAVYSLKCVVGDPNSVSLSWAPSTDWTVAGYNVYRSPNSWGPRTKLNPTLLRGLLFYTDDGIPSGQRVYYTLGTVDIYGREVYTPLSQADMPHAVSLTWTPSISPNVVGYHVYRGTSPNGPYTRLTPAPVALTGYTDYHVPYGQMYYYVATTVDASGAESGYSLPAQAVIPLN